MKKKISLIIGLVMAFILVFGSAASAYGGDIEIDVSDIEVSSEWAYIGQTVTVSGTVQVTSTADGFLIAAALAEAGYSINGVGYSTEYSESDYDWDLGFWANADASVYLDWSVDVKVTTPGNYYVSQYGHGETLEFLCYDEDTVIESRMFTGYIPDAFTLLIPYGGQSAFYRNNDISTVIDVVGRYNGTQYRFVIPSGTEITSNGQKSTTLLITSIDGDTIASTFDQMAFSNPVTVYKAEGTFHMDIYGNWVGGTWVELGTFSTITDGQATLE